VNFSDVGRHSTRQSHGLFALAKHLYYSAPVGQLAQYCDQFVCVSVCPRAYLWNRWTDLHDFFVQIPCDRGSVLLWRRCATLCTSGFLDDVTFGRSGPYDGRCDTRAESDVCGCLVT